MCYFLHIFKDSHIQKMDTLFTLVFVTAIVLFNYFYNSFTFSETLRYMFDMGYNIGMGNGNINEKDDMSLFATSLWMLFGNVIFFKWCLALVKASLGMESSGLMHGVADKGRTIVQWVSSVFHLPPKIFVIILIVLWTTFGICIGVIVEEWTFIKSLNFAIGGMTTTGSQLPDNNELSNILTAIFLAIGVPLLSIVTSVVILPEFVPKDDVVSTDEETNELVNKNAIHF